MKRKNLVVVVTGASTGIGYCIASELASDGHRVYAGARKMNDIKRLSSGGKMTGIQLDVTNLAQIEAAVRQIEEKKDILMF